MSTASPRLVSCVLLVFVSHVCLATTVYLAVCMVSKFSFRLLLLKFFAASSSSLFVFFWFCGRSPVISLYACLCVPRARLSSGRRQNEAKCPKRVESSQKRLGFEPAATFFSFLSLTSHIIAMALPSLFSCLLAAFFRFPLFLVAVRANSGLVQRLLRLLQAF
eukprot:m.40131 g.40131  ORF g.40131 m.40131 type:complete len:163 (+) comp5981_c0_seq1:1382-1870(+)